MGHCGCCACVPGQKVSSMGAGASTDGLTPSQKEGISRELQARYAQTLEGAGPAISDSDSIQVYKSLKDAYEEELTKLGVARSKGFTPIEDLDNSGNGSMGIDEVVGPAILVRSDTSMSDNGVIPVSHSPDHFDDDFDHSNPMVRTKTSQDMLSELEAMEDHKAKISSFISSLKDGDISTTRSSKFRIRRLTYSQRTVEAPEPGSPVTKLTKRTTIYASTEIGVRQEKVAPFPENYLGTFSCHGIEPSDEDETGIHDKINQDRGCVVYPYNSSNTEALFLALDGHGEQGDKVSEFVMRQIVVSLEKHPSLATDPALALKETFIKTNIALMTTSINYMTSGCTCVCAYVTGNKLYVANCGDSRAVMATGSRFDNLKSKNLSRDHKPDDPEEAARITEWGGFIQPAPEPGLTARVYLDAAHTMIGLAMARSIGECFFCMCTSCVQEYVCVLAFFSDPTPPFPTPVDTGDFAVKNVGVIAEPEVLEFDISTEDQFMILASDGVWEFIYSQEAVDIVSASLRQGKNVTQACQELIEASSARWVEEEGDYRDDITAVIIRLPLPFQGSLLDPTA